MKNNISFTKQNYYIILAGLAVVVLGFILMSGGGSEDATKWNPEIFSARRITVAPILVMAGYVVVLIGIIKKTRNEKLSNNEGESQIDLGENN